MLLVYHVLFVLTDLKEIKKIKGIKNLEIDFHKGIITLTASESKKITYEMLNKAIENAGFTLNKITRNFR